MKPSSFRGMVGMLLLAAMLVLVACGGQAPRQPAADSGSQAGGSDGGAEGKEPLVIGVIAPFNTPSGDGLLNGADMAVKEINAAGGILGRPIKLITANTEYKPDKGASSYQKLVLNDGAVAVIGSASSGVSLAVQEQMARYKTVFLNTGAAASSLAAKVAEDYDKYKYWFRVMHDSPELGRAVIDFIKGYLKQHGKTKYAIFSENAVWTEELIAMWEQELDEDPDLEHVGTEVFDVETKDFVPIFQRLIDSGADTILDISAHVDAAGYTKQWADLKAPPMGGVAAAAFSSRFWNDVGERGAYRWTTNPGYRVALTEKTLDWYDKYTETYGISPDYTSGYTYDAFYILKEALEKVGRADDQEALVKALEETDYTGVYGRWMFQKDHHPVYGEGYRELPIVQWLPGGERQVIWPPQIATGEYQDPEWAR